MSCTSSIGDFHSKELKKIILNNMVVLQIINIHIENWVRLTALAITKNTIVDILKSVK